MEFNQYDIITILFSRVIGEGIGQRNGQFL